MPMLTGTMKAIKYNFEQYLILCNQLVYIDEEVNMKTNFAFSIISVRFIFCVLYEVLFVTTHSWLLLNKSCASFFFNN
jgi:hypothetical protein